MSLTIGDLAKRRKETSFTWPDPEGVEQEVKLVYNPGWYTGEREQEISTWSGGTLGEKNAHWLSSMLLSWDVLDGSGKPYPTDYDSVYKLDREFVAKALDVALGDCYPNLPSAGNSGAGS